MGPAAVATPLIGPRVLRSRRVPDSESSCCTEFAVAQSLLYSADRSREEETFSGCSPLISILSVAILAQEFALH